jgi:hypothetical protein
LTSDLQRTVRPERSAEGAKSKGRFRDASTSLAARATLSANGFFAPQSFLPIFRRSAFVFFEFFVVQSFFAPARNHFFFHSGS